jgi:hypothetical protein
MHPATFKHYYGLQMGFAPHVNDTWTEAQIKACGSFIASHGWRDASENERELIVQARNIGDAGVFIEEKRNPEYLARWLEAYDKVRSGTSFPTDRSGTKKTDRLESLSH